MMGRKLLKKDSTDKGHFLPLLLLLSHMLIAYMNAAAAQGMMGRKLLKKE
jgi:hypothetical protein